MEKILFNKIAEHLSKSADVPLEKITLESSFKELGLDSLDALALINDLEEEYSVNVSDQEVLKIRTVGQAVEIFHKAMA